MISHLSECIKKGLMVGYGGLLSSILKKFGVSMDGLQFPMSANNQMSAKCLKNLHLNLNDKGILEDIIEVEDVSSEEEEEGKTEEGKEKEEKEKKDQDVVPSASTDKAEVNKEQGKACSEGEASVEKGDELEEVDSSDSSSDEEVAKPIKEESKITPRKSRRLASKLSVGKDEGTTTHPTKKPINVPSSPQPASNIPSPPPSPIATSPPPFTSQPSPTHTGFDMNPSTVPPASFDLLLTKFDNLQSLFYAFQDETRVSVASITDQLSQMESRLGAKLDTVEVQTEFVDEETAT